MPLPTFYRPELDGMRFLAFFSVFIGHAFSSEADFYAKWGLPRLAGRIIVAVITSGHSGVPLFFLLSSYLITELLTREEKARGEIDVKSFYFRRALRIWPLYFVYILANYLLIPTTSPYVSSPAYLLTLIFFAGNIPLMLKNPLGWRTGVTGHLWSVSVEEQFYLIWPWVLRWFGATRLLPLTVTLIVAAAVIRVLMTLAGLEFDNFWYNTLTWVDAIAVGALLAHILQGRVFHLSTVKRLCLIAAGPFCWTLATVVLARIPWAHPVFYLLITGGSLLMLIGTLGAPFLRGKVLVYLGRISYGLYVFHFIGLILAALVFEEHSVAHIIAGLLTTIALASISYRFLESPFLRLKKKFTYIPSTESAESL